MTYTTRTEARRFTLVELVTALAILTIMVLLLFQALSTMQRTWTESDRQREIFESARIALHVISQDIKGMVASDFAGELICVDADGTGTPPYAFVSSTFSDGASTADLYEIGYSRSATDSQLIRWKTGSADGASWDFFNTYPSTWTASWGDSEVVGEGVTAFSLEFFKRDATPPDYRTAYNAASDSDTLPDIVRVTLGLVPTDIVDLPDSAQAKYVRTFTKLIFLDD